MRRMIGLLGALALLLTGCGSQEVPAAPAVPEASETEENRQETPLVYQWGELTAEIPGEVEELLTVEQKDGSEDGLLLTVCETASLERAAADGVDAREEGWGWICTLAAFDRAQYEENLTWDAPGVEFIGKDEERWYALIQPTDVRLYTSDGVLGGTELESWGKACEAADLLATDFVARNGLTPWTREEIYNSWHPYDSLHLTYLWTPEQDPEMNEVRLVLSQPATQGEGGIWCVERFEHTGGYGGSFYFPHPGIDSRLWYAGIQQEHDNGSRSDHATPEAAIATFLAENPYLPDSAAGPGTLILLDE